MLIKIKIPRQKAIDLKINWCISYGFIYTYITNKQSINIIIKRGN